MIRELDNRTRQILKLAIDAYIATGEPVGSLAISQNPNINLSPATIRHILAELQERGLLYAPHASAGRLPTEAGMTVFVESLLEVDTLSAQEESLIQRQLHNTPQQQNIFEKASAALSEFSSCAGLVFAPNNDEGLRQIEFSLLSPGRAIAIIVFESGQIENRLITIPPEVTSSTLQRASNYLNAQITQQKLSEKIEFLRQDMAQDRHDLDALTKRVIEAGIASLAPLQNGGHLFIKGQANLLNNVQELADIERIRCLFDALDRKENILRILEATSTAEGIRIFIGAENKLFNHAGCSLIVAPYKNAQSRIVGAIGVIGPTRLNYQRVIPVINYTSQLMQEWISEKP